MHIARLRELTTHQSPELWVLSPREQQRRGGQAQLQVRTSRLAELFVADGVVEHIVDQLEREAEILAVQVRRLDGVGRTVRTVTVPDGSAPELDLQGVAAGLYTVQVQLGDRLVNKRLSVAP